MPPFFVETFKKTSDFARKNTFLAVILSLIFLIFSSTALIKIFNLQNRQNKQPYVFGQNQNSTQNLSRAFSSSKSSQSSFANFSFKNIKLEPLIVDSEHEVIVLESCDLAIKFKKEEGFKPTLQENSEFEPEYRNRIQIKNYFTLENPRTGESRFYVKCNDTKFDQERIVEIQKGKNYSQPELTSFCQSLNLQTDFCGLYEPILSQKPTAGRLSSHYFRRGNFYYHVGHPSDQLSSKIQFQPNSLASSTPSLLLGSEVGVQPLVADSEHEVTVSNECDLAVRWKKTLSPKTVWTEEESLLDSLNFQKVETVSLDLLISEGFENRIDNLQNRYRDGGIFCYEKPQTLEGSIVAGAQELEDLYSFTQASKKRIRLETLRVKNLPKENGESGGKMYSFQAHNGKNYLFFVPFSQQKDIEIQFNSLSPSQETRRPPISHLYADKEKPQAPLTPLVADEEHEVIVLEECDLAIKFSKKHTVTKNSISGDILRIDEGDVSDQNRNSFGIYKCSKQIPTFDEEDKEVYNIFWQNPDALTDSQKKRPSRKLGMKNLYLQAEFIKFRGAGDGGTIKLVAKNGMYYEIFETAYLEKPIIISQIQINSLAPSTPSLSLD